MSGFLIVVVALVGLVALITALGVRQVSQGQAVVIERVGKYHKTLHPGVNFILPILDRAKVVADVNQPGSGVLPSRIDLREQILDVKEQTVITRDNVQMVVDTVVFYQVVEPHRAVYEVSAPVAGIRQICATTVRSLFGEMDLDTSLSSREAVNARLRTELDEVTDKWGIRVSRVEIQDIRPPADLIEAMKQQMEAERARRAAVTRAEGQKQSEVLQAEGVKAARILEAEGEAESIRLVQEATAKGLDAVRNVFGKAEGRDSLLALETLKAQQGIARELASGSSTKLYLPTSLAGLFGAVDGIRELFKTRDSFVDPEGEGKPTP